MKCSLKYLLQRFKGFNFLTFLTFLQCPSSEFVWNMNRKGQALPKANLPVEEAYCFGRAQTKLFQDALSSTLHLRFNTSMYYGCLIHGNSVSQLQYNVKCHNRKSDWEFGHNNLLLFQIRYILYFYTG